MNKAQKVKELFSDMAEKIADEYATDIVALTTIRGSKLNFNELKEKTFELDKMLKERAVKILETFKKETGENTDLMIDEFRVIIVASLERFIKTL